MVPFPFSFFAGFWKGLLLEGVELIISHRSPAFPFRRSVSCILLLKKNLQYAFGY